MNELNKNLAESAGFEWDGRGLHYPRVGEKAQIVYCPNPPNFPESLDACFKWLMKPVREKLGEKGYFVFLMRWILHAEEGKEALDLCLAIEKVIDEQST